MPTQPDEDDSRVEGVNRRQWNGKRTLVSDSSCLDFQLSEITRKENLGACVENPYTISAKLIP